MGCCIDSDRDDYVEIVEYKAGKPTGTSRYCKDCWERRKETIKEAVKAYQIAPSRKRETYEEQINRLQVELRTLSERLHYDFQNAARVEIDKTFHILVKAKNKLMER